MSGVEGITIRRADPSEPEIAAIIAVHNAHSRLHSPEQSIHCLAADQMQGVDLYAICLGGVPVGCAGLKPLGDGLAEVKSVHVLERVRGRGLSRRLMAHLVDVSRDGGIGGLVLETGSQMLTGFDAARRLYLSLGFVECPPIPGYAPDPASSFFRLDPSA